MSLIQFSQIAISGGKVKLIPLPSSLFPIVKLEYILSDSALITFILSIKAIFGLVFSISPKNASRFSSSPCKVNLTPALPLFTI
ncbi:hypothetical protein ES703_96161 [subsurface metagenome]